MNRFLVGIVGVVGLTGVSAAGAPENVIIRTEKMEVVATTDRATHVWVRWPDKRRVEIFRSKTVVPVSDVGVETCDVAVDRVILRFQIAGDSSRYIRVDGTNRRWGEYAPNTAECPSRDMQPEWRR